VLTLAQIDARTYLLPDRLTQPLIWLGLLYHGLYQQDTLTDALYGAVAGYLSLWLVWWVYRLITGKEGLGLGDAKLLAALGAWCGWQALSMILLGASLMGIGCWIVLRLSRGAQVPHIAFGPWLGLAGLIIFTMQLLGVEIY
jgi:prepilin signal peptidase PulO-like enzyme (type II secretory pathway)